MALDQCHTKVCATVTTDRDARGYVMAIDAAGNEFILREQAVHVVGQHTFLDLRVGSKVSLTPIPDPKGLRGTEVQILEL